MMGRNGLTVALAALLLIGATELALATFAGPASPSGPWPRVTGNDTGGIIPYSPALEGQYEQMAEAYCARWHRISKVTSVHRAYGDYISFACIDKPWVFH